MVSPAGGFATIPISFVRIPVMLVGELDFYDSFLTESDCYRNKEMVYAILIIFIFGITISLANLLVSVCLFVCLFVCLLVCLFVSMFVCLFVCLFVSMFVC